MGGRSASVLALCSVFLPVLSFGSGKGCGATPGVNQRFCASDMIPPHLHALDITRAGLVPQASLKGTLYNHLAVPSCLIH